MGNQERTASLFVDKNTKGTKTTSRTTEAPAPSTAAQRQRAEANGSHLIGYGRVSSLGQDTTIQEAKLREAGCSIIRTEKVSGKSREGRNELAAILDFLRQGDVVVALFAAG